MTPLCGQLDDLHNLRFSRPILTHGFKMSLKMNKRRWFVNSDLLAVG